MSAAFKTYEDYHAHMRKLADLEATLAVMAWDKEVYMPEKGARFRTQQMATLSGILHEESTKPEFIALVENLATTSNGLDEDQRRNVTLSWRDLQRTLRLDTDFVVRRSRLISEGYHAWIKAREANEFAVFAEVFEQLVELKQEEAQRQGYEDHPYDALLEDYESGCTVRMLDTLFGDARQLLVDFAGQLQLSDAPHPLHQHFDKDEQWAYGLDLLKKLGYDFSGGRQDLSTHPFTITFSAEDVRVTTRIDENDLANLTLSCIHEAGHALYEQGLPAEQYGLPLGRATSLGIHESQSRLWENHVGRGRAFWRREYPNLQSRFSQLKDVHFDTFYRAVNLVKPNLIRTEADELHYHFHVMVRYEIEKGLVEGSLGVNDIPAIWKKRYHDYLGVEVPDDLRGALQDIHWSHGSLGYFPTYSLGSFYAAQFFHQAQQDIPGLEDQLSAGQTGPLLSWLRENIHQYGRKYQAEDLCQRVTGEPLHFRYFMDYAKSKYLPLFGQK